MKEIRLSQIKGIGEKKEQLFSKLGIRSALDMLLYLPRAYKDYSLLVPCAALQSGEAAVVIRIAVSPTINYYGKGKSTLTTMGHDETGRVNIIYFNQPYKKNAIKTGASYIVTGKVEKHTKGYTFTNPEMELLEEGNVKGIVPVYALTGGLTQGALRNCAVACTQILRQNPLPETLPPLIRQDYALCERNFALENVHFPVDSQSLSLARGRLLLEEIVYYMLLLEQISGFVKNQAALTFRTQGLYKTFVALLPFTPTNAQKRTMMELTQDMQGACCMNRLVQGDVGSGKTVVALYALYAAVVNGYQGVMMAPTEVLARQHYDTCQKVFGALFEIELLVGSLTLKNKRQAQHNIAQGKSKIIIGTHAVISEGVRFDRLGLVITDEQHRFGVRQRALISAKGDHPHVLIMSATPIPRTLTLILYGDLDVSIIDELPPNRKAVQTSFVPVHKRADMYTYIANKAKNGEQAYVVCPLIEQSDIVDALSAQEVYDEITQGALIGVQVALLHGRLSAQEKDRILGAFKQGQISVLVSTTVIEVGVDVPNASIMVIEGAQRFGLAQLHQLRGRVGRGDKQSYCFLLSGIDDANERLKILCKSSDGFVIAQKDLELRGPGEFLGSAQSGEGDFKYARFVSDIDQLQKAQQIVKRLSKEPAYMPFKEQLLRNAVERFGDQLKDISFN